MAHKELKFNEDARRSLERGVNILADAVKVKGLAPLAAKTDRIDARVLAELGRRDLVPAIWLPDPANRAERERASARRKEAAEEWARKLQAEILGRIFAMRRMAATSEVR